MADAPKKAADAPKAERARNTSPGESLQRALRWWRIWSSRADVRVACVATLALRLVCSAVAALIVVLFPQAIPPSAGLARYLTAPWWRWDTIWYLKIAEHGYTDYGSTAFLPLYPLLIRGLGTLLGGHFLAAALLISTLASFGALLCLYRLAEKLSQAPQVAPWTVLAAVLLPVSFFLMAGYTEALFLWLTFGALLAWMEGRWGRFAALAVLATLTRHQGVLLSLLVAPLCLRALWELLQKRSAGVAGAASGATLRVLGKALGAGLAGPLAYLGWVLVVGLLLSAPLPWEPLAASNGWNLHYTWPGAGIVADLVMLTQPALALRLGLGLSTLLLDALAALLTGAVLLVAARRLPPELLLFAWAVWCLALVKVQSQGLTVSAARYLLPLLPLAILPGGLLARGRPWQRLVWVAGWSLALLLLIAAFVLNDWVA
ncbi:MAG TPA: mannosyltransferase family protein [Ktedonobacterales bacterium]|jgi:hypothetical protein